MQKICASTPKNSDPFVNLPSTLSAADVRKYVVCRAQRLVGYEYRDQQRPLRQRARQFSFGSPGEKFGHGNLRQNAEAFRPHCWKGAIALADREATQFERSFCCGRYETCVASKRSVWLTRIRRDSGFMIELTQILTTINNKISKGAIHSCLQEHPRRPCYIR